MRIINQLVCWITTGHTYVLKEKMIATSDHPHLSLDKGDIGELFKCEDCDYELFLIDKCGR